MGDFIDCNDTPKHEVHKEQVKKTPLEDFEKYFSNLNVSSSGNRLQPNKAIMMLTVADLVSSGLCETPEVRCDEMFRHQFVVNWDKYSKDTAMFTLPDIRALLRSMKDERFWNVIDQGDCIAVLDDELFAYLKDRKTCYKLRWTLASNYLPSSMEEFKMEYKIVNFLIINERF